MIIQWVNMHFKKEIVSNNHYVFDKGQLQPVLSRLNKLKRIISTEINNKITSIPKKRMFKYQILSALSKTNNETSSKTISRNQSNNE